MSEFSFNTIPEAIEDLKLGKIIILVDDEDRENEGDFVCAAEFATPENVNFMAKYGRGLICTPITLEDAKRLELPFMVEKNTAKLGTAFTISIDATEGITTGISSFDRSKTIKLLADPKTKASDFARPGHIFPLISKCGGTLERNGHTEASIDLMKLSNLYKASVICEILDDEGYSAKLPTLFELKEKHNLKLITIESLEKYLKEKG